DAAAAGIAARLRAALGPGNYALAVFPPATYNRLHDRMHNVNRILAWAHARCIEELRRKRPGMRFAISDQFGSADAVRRAMRAGGEPLEIRSRTKAESDVAVAAASLLAREAFLAGLADLSRRFPLRGLQTLPKGATHVRDAAEKLVRAYGPQVLSETCKLHFRTTAQILAAAAPRP
ncbi:MAG: hypothetical protein IJ678_05425, partial [Kiritimatiellae bacterium]|nr:hypothetical protein [Kiritimatiellia bacterium]